MERAVGDGAVREGVGKRYGAMPALRLGNGNAAVRLPRDGGVDALPPGQLSSRIDHLQDRGPRPLAFGSGTTNLRRKGLKPCSGPLPVPCCC